eukprot:3696812-Alexandrium_andersonii.AAC.1
MGGTRGPYSRVPCASPRATCIGWSSSRPSRQPRTSRATISAHPTLRLRSARRTFAYLRSGLR